MAATIGLERFAHHSASQGHWWQLAGMVVVVSDQVGAAVPLPRPCSHSAGRCSFSALTTIVVERLPPGDPMRGERGGRRCFSSCRTSCSRSRRPAHESWALPEPTPRPRSPCCFLVRVSGRCYLFPLALFIIGRWTASGYSYTNLFKPLAAVVLAAVILGESVRLTFLLGGALVLIGLSLGALQRALGAPSTASVVTDAEPNVVPVPVTAADAALDTAGRTRLSPQV